MKHTTHIDRPSKSIRRALCGLMLALPITAALAASPEILASPSVPGAGVEPLTGTAQVHAMEAGSAGFLYPAASSSVAVQRVEGPGFVRERVEARSRDAYRLRFRGGQRAVVTLTGDGDTDLDLYIYDENDNLIVSDIGPTDRAQVTWTPAWTGEFTVRVVNLGYVWNEYVLTTN